MPVPYLRRLTGKDRSHAANRQLASVLAFIAGAIDAGGYVAVRQYTSHMSGTTSTMANHLATGNLKLAAAGLSAMLAFVAGAACTAVLVNWGRRRRIHSEYAFPLMLEAALLVCFGLMGRRFEAHHWLLASATVGLLCFTMGLQNAIITKISHAEIRTTHVTGMVTDIGIELGRLVYWNRGAYPGQQEVRADRENLWMLVSLVGLFVIGGVAGAIGFVHVGFEVTLPIAVVLLLLASVPVMDDLRAIRRV
jgi:uncharacterized membrane protein YoaK (UPF0700 family)